MQALTALATFFIDGFHVKADHARALALAKAAANRGHANGQKLVDEHAVNGGFTVRPINQVCVVRGIFLILSE